MHCKEEKRLSASASNIKSSLNDQLLNNIHVFQRNVHFLYPYFLFFLVTLIWNKSIFQDVSKQDGRTIHRKYYTAARRYEISLLVLKKYFTSERSRVKYMRREIFISPSGHVMFYLLYKHQWNTKQYFGVKGMIYYEAIATVIFSHVKISSFCTKAHLVFHWC